MGFTSALETAQRVKAGSLRAADHVAEVLARIEARNPECNRHKGHTIGTRSGCRRRLTRLRPLAARPVGQMLD